MRLAAGMVLLVATACSPVPAPHRPAPPLDAGGPATCATACARLRELGCEGAGSTNKGASCEDVCLNVQSSGVVAWNLACQTAAHTCAEIDACEQE